MHATVGHIDRKYLRLLVLVVSVGLVVAYCVRHASDLGVLLRLDLGDLAALLLLTVATNAVMAYKVFVMLGWLGLRGMTWLAWMRLFAASRLANFYITQGANLYRAVKLKRDYSFSYSHSVGITAVITCFDIASVLFVTALLLIAVGGFRSAPGWIMLLASLVLVGCLLLLPALARWVEHRAGSATSRWPTWLRGRTAALGEAIRRCMHSPRGVAFLAALTVLTCVTYLAAAAVCLAAFSRQSSFLAAALLASAYLLSQTVKVVPGNVGISELVMGLSTGAVMDDMVYGVMIAVVFRVVDFLVIGTAFLAFALADGGKKADGDSGE